MKWIHLFSILLLTSGCDLQEFFYPADEHMVLPDGREMRLHCNPECPPHEDIKVVMDDVASHMTPHLTHSPWAIWSHYAINFSEHKFYCTGRPDCIDGTQIQGATDHNRNGIYIYYGDHWIEVLEWELKLPLVESVLPYSDEPEKIEWLASVK